uniref:Uncharacterized protein n=1 Tax=Opuntia streptacantha TaxID=393608 RepID=A0A7C8ZUD6_OPUST
MDTPTQKKSLIAHLQVWRKLKLDTPKKILKNYTTKIGPTNLNKQSKVRLSSALPCLFKKKIKIKFEEKESPKCEVTEPNPASCLSFTSPDSLSLSALCRSLGLGSRSRARRSSLRSATPAPKKPKGELRNSELRRAEDAPRLGDSSPCVCDLRLPSGCHSFNFEFSNEVE